MKNVNLSCEEAVAKAIKKCGVDHFFYVTREMMITPAIGKEGVNMILCRNLENNPVKLEEKDLIEIVEDTYAGR